MASKSTTSTPDHQADYLHGYSAEEQSRLVSQALYLEAGIYPSIAFAQAKHVLEVGCGVGAQLSILHRRFPQVHLTGIDRSEAQLAAARALLAGPIAAGAVSLVHGDGAALPFAARTFDGAFLCWILEHAASPSALLAETRRVLAPGAVIYCTEVFNASLFISPPAPAVMTYWNTFNRFQEEIGGAPNIGAHLPALLAAAGFHDITSRPLPWSLDRRTAGPAARAAFVTYWQAVLLSAVPGLKAAKRVDDDLIRQVEREFQKIEQNLDAVVYVCAMQSRAIA